MRLYWLQVNNLPSADAEHDIVLVANSDVDGEFTQTSVKKPVYGNIRCYANPFCISAQVLLCIP